ncbi:MAG: hypothetical protein EPO36_07935 [Chloroflexota bacterium]|nr:MAG: hypothetical protein EPO36_07935 [Chloroflexota bacterium]
MRAAGAAAALGIAMVVAALVIAMSAAGPVIVRAASPEPSATTSPTARPPTCAERYPAEGPGGVDLQLGCLVNELVSYAGGLGPSDQPQRLTAYLAPIAAVAAGLAVLLLVARQLNRRAARRVAPATPVAWWSCPACRSLNAAGRDTCYRCGRPFEVGAVEMRTDAEPPAPQAFGRRDLGDRP